MRVVADHRFAIPVERGFAFITDTSNWSKFWPGYVRLEKARAGEQRANRIITYTSMQPGLPDASHERRFEPRDGGFVYRLGVEYVPRSGLVGLFDRFVLAGQFGERSGGPSSPWNASSRPRKSRDPA
jgi:hypothetical protein